MTDVVELRLRRAVSAMLRVKHAVPGVGAVRGFALYGHDGLRVEVELSGSRKTFAVRLRPVVSRGPVTLGAPFAEWSEDVKGRAARLRALSEDVCRSVLAHLVMAS